MHFQKTTASMGREGRGWGTQHDIILSLVSNNQRLLSSSQCWTLERGKALQWWWFLLQAFWIPKQFFIPGARCSGHWRWLLTPKGIQWSLNCHLATLQQSHDHWSHAHFANVHWYFFLSFPWDNMINVSYFMEALLAYNSLVIHPGPCNGLAFHFRNPSELALIFNIKRDFSSNH